MERAFFISPVLDMENLILGMMKQACVTETDLRERGEVRTDFGETLSWKYLSFVCGANGIENFRYRFVDGHVVLFDRIDALVRGIRSLA